MWMLTVFIQEHVLDILDEELLYGLTDLLLLLQDVWIILRVVPLRNSWKQREAVRFSNLSDDNCLSGKISKY